jgi:DNA repair exonuclease SbcCD ATPase subunit
MILEGFEIENWSCIKRLAIDCLPPTGIVVLHGPNGTGKSSIVAALRACLMDYPATSTAKDLKRWFPKNGSDKPRVSVAFRAQGVSWRITKHFGSRESKLESRTAAGSWKSEESTAADAHEHTRLLIGDKRSDAGLQQLLWLTQAEFHLPEPKEFDGDVQSQLRSVLGVLQTPLDDRFLGCVKQEWSRWFGARSKPGEKPRLKKDCALDQALAVLEQHKAELAEIEREYEAFEKMTQNSGNLEVLARDLRRQQEEKTRARDLLQQEYEKSLKRLDAYRVAVDRVTRTEKALCEGQALRQRRADALERIDLTEKSAETARRDVEEKARRLEAAESTLRELRREAQVLGHVGREMQARLNAVSEHRQLLTLKEQVKTARENLRRAEQTAGELEDSKKQARERPALDDGLLKELEKNRAKAGKLRADLEAAAIALTICAEPGAPVARLAIDGAAAVEAAPSGDGTPIRYSVRRRADIAIPGWGRAELTRGADARSLDHIENDLSELDREFAEALAPFGISAGDPTALDQLRGSAADKKVRKPEMKRKTEEIDRLAPQGLDHLRQEVARLEKTVSARESVTAPCSAGTDPSTVAADLERLAAQLKEEIDANERNTGIVEQKVEAVEREIDGAADADSAVGKKINADRSKTAVPGLRRQEADAKDTRAALTATAEVLRGELDRMLTAEQIDHEIRDAEEALRKAREDLESAKLSESEETIRERLDAATDGLQALQEQLAAADKEFHQIEGALRLTEGLHQKRAAAAARVEELTRQTERELLQSEAYDRLYALFEECREKQLGAVMGPIHDRVLRWMRLLCIGAYQSIRFNDQFLPEKLIAGDGATELTLGEESTGTIEQIALMVRLALGSTLSTPDEPVVALLDDPLTHSDVVRLDRMRAVLKNAATGDNGLRPPAGPLQILVFTCHPEWFSLDGAQIIDLAKPDVLSKCC